MPVSPIKRVGGKHALRKSLINLLPEDSKTYVEVFGGAAWVLLGKARHPIEVFNDADRMLMNLWRVIKWRPAELLERVQLELYSRERFNELKEGKPQTEDEMELAVWYYLLIQMSFGAVLHHPVFGVRVKNPRGPLFGGLADKQIEPAFARLQNVYIECQHFRDIFKRYDTPDTIFFCDPPYLGLNRYGSEFGQSEHEELARTLRTIAGKFLLTINDCSETRALYSDWAHVRETSEQRCVSYQDYGRKAAPVLIVANYPLEQAKNQALDTALAEA